MATLKFSSGFLSRKPNLWTRKKMPRVSIHLPIAGYLNSLCSSSYAINSNLLLKHLQKGFIFAEITKKKKLNV